MKKTTLLLALTRLVCNAARHACLWAALGLLAALGFGPPPAQGAVTEAWVQRYNGPANYSDRANAVAVDGSGNVVVTGASASGCDPDYGCGYPVYDYYTAKYAAADGALLWEKRYDGGYDQAQALAVDANGNVVVTGYSGVSSTDDYYTAKYAAADGALLWEKRSNGGGWAVAVDGSGNVVVTGSSYGTNVYSNYYTAKYAATNGALLWEQRGPANSHGFALVGAVDGSGNVVVTGYSSGGADYYTAKYAAAGGALLWEKPSGGQAVAVDGSDNVVVTWSSWYDGASYTAKYAAADGALLWEKPSGGHALAVDGSDNVVVTGNSYNGTNFDYYTAKYAAADGALLWEKRYNSPGNYDEQARAVTVDANGNVLVTGSSDNDYFTAKYAAADGALLWEKRYNGGAASSLAPGPNGMVAVTGSSSGDYATVVYRENLPPVSIARVPAGVRLRLIGIPGRSYTIERAPAVTGPWSTLATPTAPLNGLIEYTDAPPPAGSAFYRTAQP